MGPRHPLKDPLMGPLFPPESIPMSDPIITAAKAGIAGIREALSVGKEVGELVRDIQQLGDAEIAARSAYRKKRRVQQGDTTWIDALQEYERLKRIKDAEAELRAEILKRPNGDQQWAEILQIKQRLKEEAELEAQHKKADRLKMSALKWTCFILAVSIVVYFYK